MKKITKNDLIIREKTDLNLNYKPSIYIDVPFPFIETSEKERRLYAVEYKTDFDNSKSKAWRAIISPRDFKMEDSGIEIDFYKLDMCPVFYSEFAHLSQATLPKLEEVFTTGFGRYKCFALENHRFCFSSKENAIEFAKKKLIEYYNVAPAEYYKCESVPK